MDYKKNFDIRTALPIGEDIRKAYDDQLARFRQAARSAAPGMLQQQRCPFAQVRDHVPRGDRIFGSNVVMNATQIVQRLPVPAQGHQAAYLVKNASASSSLANSP